MWSTAGLSSALAGQVPSSLELKVEKPDKDDMSDNLSTDNMGDDDSEKNMRTPRAGTRTRYNRSVDFLSLNVREQITRVDLWISLFKRVKLRSLPQSHRGRGPESGAEGWAGAGEEDGQQRPRAPKSARHQRGFQGAGTYVPDAPEKRETSDQTAHPPSGCGCDS